MKKRKLITLATCILFGIFLLFTGCGGGGGSGSDDSDNESTPTVAFNQPSSWGNESDTPISLAVSLSSASDKTVTVDYEVTDGSADEGGVDYTLLAGTLKFKPNEKSKSIAIDIVDDATPEENETIVVTLSNARNATLVDSTSHTYTIIDNEPAMTVALNQIEIDCSNSNFTEVTAFVSVVDQKGEPITGLTTLNFALHENTSVISNFTAEFVDQVQKPISVAIVMDYSKSMQIAGAIDSMEDAVIEFVNLLNADDEAEIIKFSTEIKVVQEFTSDKDKLETAILSPFTGSGTHLYDAVKKAIDDTALAPDRKAVIVITDGQEYGSIIGLDDLTEYALLNDVPLFTIGLGNDIDIDSLEQMAEETGGLFYLAATADDLETIYQQIADIFVLEQYVLTYDSFLSGNVELEVDADYNGLQDSDSKQFATCP